MTSAEFADRITFHADIQAMEVDFSNLTFATSETVNAFYDEIDQRLNDSGKKWFFLVNYKDCTIMPEAWISFAYRGKKTNIAYSLGSVRFAARGDTMDTILEKSKKEAFDPNLFPSREKAIEHLEQLRKDIPEAEFENRLKPDLPPPSKPMADRITFHEDLGIMEVDYSGYTFDSSATVNRFYDEITKQIAATNEKWYFMVNYGNTEILPEAWYTWTMRGKKLNSAYSLGTVRFDPQDSARQDILKRARADEFNPNLVATREDALARIEQLKQQNHSS